MDPGVQAEKRGHAKMHRYECPGTRRAKHPCARACAMTIWPLPRVATIRIRKCTHIGCACLPILLHG
eukprot:376727-Lingulodinium_polyedra.AAC.1